MYRQAPSPNIILCAEIPSLFDVISQALYPASAIHILLWPAFEILLNFSVYTQECILRLCGWCACYREVQILVRFFFSSNCEVDGAEYLPCWASHAK